MKKLILLILTFMFSIHCFAESGSAVIAGDIAALQDNETVRLTVSRYGYPMLDFDSISYFCKVVHHSFHFKIKTGDVPLQVQIAFHANRFEPGVSNDFRNIYSRMNIHYGFIETGDHVFIANSANGLSFSGKGSAKFKIIGHINETNHKSFIPDMPSSEKTAFEHVDASCGATRFRLFIVKIGFPIIFSGRTPCARKCLII